MKIYHKILLYQNKLLQPYVRILLRMMAVLTYMASLLLIVGVVYEHGFPLSATDISHLKILYKAVWIIFLIDVTLHIFLEYNKENLPEVGVDIELATLSDVSSRYIPSSR